jgi:hypothetical protein
VESAQRCLQICIKFVAGLTHRHDLQVARLLNLFYLELVAAFNPLKLLITNVQQNPDVRLLPLDCQLYLLDTVFGLQIIVVALRFALVFCCLQ